MALPVPGWLRDSDELRSVHSTGSEENPVEERLRHVFEACLQVSVSTHTVTEDSAACEAWLEKHRRWHYVSRVGMEWLQSDAAPSSFTPGLPVRLSP